MVIRTPQRLRTLVPADVSLVLVTISLLGPFPLTFCHFLGSIRRWISHENWLSTHVLCAVTQRTIQ